MAKNRGLETNESGDKKKVASIGLYEIDSVIKYYFDNVIVPRVETEEGTIQVPIIYGNPARWKTMQKTGLMRDESGKVQLPAITYKRTSLEKNPMASKVDAKNPLVQSYQLAYSRKNTYDNFAVLTGRKPVREFKNTVVPDYVKLQYECAVFTDYISQLNRIVEDINYANDQYWGDDHFKFLAKIDTFTIENTVTDGEDRAAKATFNITLNGYIIPNNIQKAMSNFNPKAFSPAVVSVTSEVVKSIDDIQKD